MSNPTSQTRLTPLHLPVYTDDFILRNGLLLVCVLRTKYIKTSYKVSDVCLSLHFISEIRELIQMEFSNRGLLWQWSSSLFPCHYHPTVDPYSSYTFGG